MRLHIGGNEVKEGWKILDIQPGPGVDFVGDIQDLTRFADGECDEIYASHVLEHVPVAKVLDTLKGLHRILKPGGRALIAVPDLEVMAQLIVSPETTTEHRWYVVRMMYGGQRDPHDFHYCGFTLAILTEFLKLAGFAQVKAVEFFNLFDDTSGYQPFGGPISLNVIATK